jgi:glycogen phosphorylase
MTVRAWRYLITGVSGAEVPVFLLDTDVSENDPFDRTLTDCLYGGDERYRLCQEVILGVRACACCGRWAMRRSASST